MNGVRFYLEHDTAAKRRRNEHSGNVFAAFVANGRNRMLGWDGIAAVYDYPNSPVASTGCDRGYLSLCKRIPEAKAREIHPALFSMLDHS